MVTALDDAREASASPTIGDLFDRFGPIPFWRIRTDPPPGRATERDVLRIREHEEVLCELIDGVLVEKTVGYEESLLAAWIVTLLNNFVQPRKLGLVAGADGTIRLAAGLVRIPDVSFVSRKRLPARKRPSRPIPQLVPNLVVEVLSPSNTAREMQLKLQDYFAAGAELVWYVNARTQTVEVFTSLEDSTVLKAGQTLAGGEVLPGFKVRVRELFSGIDAS